MIDKMTIAQWGILNRMLGLSQERDLVNGDECMPAWWIDNGFAVNGNAAKALARSPFVAFYKHEGGQPGIDRYRITDLGRATLQSKSP